MILKDIESLIGQVGNVTGHKNFDEIKPSVEWAEEFVLLPAIGQPMYDVINALANTDESGSGSASLSGSASASGSGSASASGNKTSETDAAILLKKCIRVIAHFAMFDYVTISDSRVTSQGLQIVETATHKTAFDYQKRDRKKYHGEKADFSLDSLLLYMEINKSKYPEWSENPAVYTQTRNLIINNTVEMQKYVEIGQSRRTYMAMRTKIKDVEMLKLRPALGEVIYAALKAYILNGGTNTNYQILLDLVAPAVAHLAIADALPSIIFRIAGETVTVATYNPIPEKEKDQFTKIVVRLTDNHTIVGNSYLDAAVKFIKNTPDLLSVSPYVDDAGHDGGIYNNSDDKKHFVGF